MAKNGIDLRNLEDNIRRLDSQIEDINNQMEKMISVNLTLQSKITELMIKQIDLIENLKKMVDLLEEAGQEEEEKTDFITPLKETMETLVSKQDEILTALQTIDKHITREYTREMLTKALK